MNTRTLQRHSPEQDSRSYPAYVACTTCHDSGWSPTFPGGDFTICGCAAGAAEVDLIVFAAEVEAHAAAATPFPAGGSFAPDDLTPPF